mgnify:CR=1 FL=1
MIALCVVHNFLRLNGGSSDQIEKDAEAEYEAQLKERDFPEKQSPELPPSSDAKKLRDQIAQDMWDDYVRLLESRRQRRRLE